MKPKIYILSGLGADERVFQLLDFTAFDVVYIQWIRPEKKETMTHYASRLLAQISSPNPIIIGLSFGGMMAIEIAQLIPAKKVILISSAKTKHEIPFYLRFIGHLGLDYVVPAFILQQSNFIVNWFFGVKGPFEKGLLKQILKDMDPVFLKWAIHQVLHWQNEKIPAHLSHIQGTADRLLPARFVKANEYIPGGGHFMVLTYCSNISDRLNAMLREDTAS